MDIIQIIILAIGLSMDSLIIALTSGAIIGNHHRVNVAKIAGMLAFIQMGLTVFGWLVGSTFARYIEEFDHWIAFGILLILGIRVIVSALKNEESSPFDPLNFKVMLGLAIATSIDATAVGLSLSFVNTQILVPAFIIGIVTFVISSVGVISGSKVGQRYNLSINMLGGIILILIACTILAGHTLLGQGQTVHL
ncbi:putative Mn2+ efflux pump MntP [Dysgonomonas sp. PFB1-18]|uniref:manganese efflux pump MntP n=1 Tax=unclassified Dysgonomonas TaxID=2630389 RepID=UPI0024746018|nr:MULTISPECIES: manganese efflux pump MntP family protein [unclassified Dysgonomonas]MDL2303154.1 manganese efflux pump MntP family protein [Dysgonomonas sp. OttesenSCG-928-D17]MDH6308250.1 putative Mn2+ efflux pump MntP [Dysgonomonas sp. PF1-14]MDH6338311.1 putative Mn2+ efflux pump MntP [Dysgonomonas sp. PF1-16]MDH6379808.1 putative Mn2+ efflux pump MntP [Dysgonomonas sp. PFB1-18]MDH6397102.1 putative Mn2+ efflux pump MntP [Dysgonomonas sp. PF1-23]